MLVMVQILMKMQQSNVHSISLIQSWYKLQPYDIKKARGKFIVLFLRENVPLFIYPNSYLRLSNHLRF